MARLVHACFDKRCRCNFAAQVALDGAGIQKQVEEASKTAASAASSESSARLAPLVEGLQERLTEASTLLPQLLPVTSVALRQRHWDQIFSLLGLVRVNG